MTNQFKFEQRVNVFLKSSPSGQVSGEVLAKLDDTPVLPVMDAVKGSRMGEVHLEGESNIINYVPTKKSQSQCPNTTIQQFQQVELDSCGVHEGRLCHQQD